MGNYKRLFIPVAIIVIPIPTLFWFSQGRILAHGPIYPWPNAEALWQVATNYLFVWISANGSVTTEPAGFFYHAYSAFLIMLGGNNFIGQILYIYLGFVGCLAGMYWLARNLGYSPVASMLSGILYIINPFLMTGMPVEIVNLRVLPYHVATPIILSLSVRFLNDPSDKRKIAVFGIAALLLGSAGYGSLQYFVLHLFLICVYILFFLVFNSKNRSIFFTNIKSSLALLITMFLVNYYWLSNLLLTLSQSFGARAEIGVVDNDLLNTLSVKLLDGFRMLPYPAQVHISPWIAFYYTPFLTVITFSFLGIALFSLLRRETMRLALFPGIMLIIFLFLSKGTSSPLSSVGRLIFQSSPLVSRLFRNPIYFEALVILSLSLLFGLGVGELIRLAKTKSVKTFYFSTTIISILLIIYGWNFLTGAPIKHQDNKYSQTLKVPKYYVNLSNYLRKKDDIFRVASIPTFIQKDVFVVYRWSGEVFVGTPSLNVSIGKPSFRPLNVRSLNFLGEESLRPELDLISPDVWRMLLRFSNVRYVTLHNDTDWKYIKNIMKIKSNQSEVNDFLYKSSYLKKIKRFGKIDLFEVNKKDILSHIYASSSTLFIDGGLESLPMLAPLLVGSRSEDATFFSEKFTDYQRRIILSKSKEKYLINHKDTDFNTKNLNFMVSENGLYEIIILSEQLLVNDIGSVSVTNNNKSIEIKEIPKQQSRAWLSLGLIKLRKGENKLSVSVNNKKIKDKYIVLRKSRRLRNNAPKIAFNKINPTKYIVSSSNANKPYFLVLSESFHPGWKAYYGHINWWQALWRKPISEKNHIKVNGYANAWYIGNHSKNEISLYFLPQSIFFIGLLISGLTFLGCVGYLGYSWRRSRGAKPVNM